MSAIPHMIAARKTADRIMARNPGVSILRLVSTDGLVVEIRTPAGREIRHLTAWMQLDLARFDIVSPALLCTAGGIGLYLP